MKPVDFDLHQPATLDAALALLAGHGDEARVLAGGQSLVPLLNFRLARPGHVVDIGRVAGLGGLRDTPDGLVIGAMVRQADAERAPAVAAASSGQAAATSGARSAWDWRTMAPITSPSGVPRSSPSPATRPMSTT